ncbi:MAG: hypothetical protein ACLFVP_05725 [Candidatus Bathyarchaeia archaeon]
MISQLVSSPDVATSTTMKGQDYLPVIRDMEGVVDKSFVAERGVTEEIDSGRYLSRMRGFIRDVPGLGES